MLLTTEIKSLENYLQQADKINTAVSEKGVDWHIDHSLKVIIGICNNIKTSDPKNYKWKFNRTRAYVFIRGSIPRGKGRAPKRVVAQGEIIHEDLQEQLKTAKTLLNEIGSLPKKAHFEHPYFGLLHLRSTIKFLKMHTLHHIKIIEDILK